MALRLLVTGASSFLGAWFCAEAVARHEVLGVHRRTPLALAGVEPVRLDLRQPRAVRRLAEREVDAVVHLAARVMGPGAADDNRRILDTVLSLGRPVVFASSTVVHWPVPTAYGEGRRAEEARVRASGLPWAILRPCAPYGPPLAAHRPRHQESFHRLVRAVLRWPLVPVVGTGRALRQPVHVRDFARAALALLEAGRFGLALDAGGGEALAVDDIVACLARAAGRRVRPLHVPTGLARRAARLLDGLDPELVAAFDTDDVADPGPLVEATGVVPRGFAEGARELVRGVRRWGG